MCQLSFWTITYLKIVLSETLWFLCKVQHCTYLSRISRLRIVIYFCIRFWMSRFFEFWIQNNIADFWNVCFSVDFELLWNLRSSHMECTQMASGWKEGTEIFSGKALQILALKTKLGKKRRKVKKEERKKGKKEGRKEKRKEEKKFYAFSI